MKAARVDEEFQRLMGQLIVPFVGFIPSQYVSRNFLNEEQYHLFKPYEDRMFIHELNGNNYFVEDETISHKIFLIKKGQLELNMMALWQLKEEVGEHTFKYFINRYVAMVNGFFRLALHLQGRQPLEGNKLNDDHWKALYYQSEALGWHLTQVKENFLPENPKEVGQLEESNSLELEEIQVVSQEIVQVLKPEPKTTEERKTERKVYLKELRANAEKDAHTLLIGPVFPIHKEKLTDQEPL
ncbi:hypothetical protein LRR18_12915 [Mangrovimonas sp. AS39]|uniref:hypothetical protein n=1 Tax=Mangrovimonas futianensis TaxID=2895523 RepID=UPI001E5167CC|nr:hypothetical protein [Mangrovimonas futianensis]MCF1192489.1 hypothetical protein [Mangrovimonas futianensis]MCF1196181.1 hypothetical protein [Mangrovimonas futianensis]